MLPGPILLYIAYDFYHREGKEPPVDKPEEIESQPGAEDASPELTTGASLPVAA
jgi:hypothetical protein